MIEFSTVSREFHSLIHRRRELQTFLGSVFVVTSLFFHNVWKGGLPNSLRSIEEGTFTFYGIMLMVPSLILALRMAKLHGGLVINGILYNRLMQEQDFTRKGDPQKAAQHNLLGVSYLQFVLADLIAALSATILAFSFHVGPAIAIGAGVAVFLLWQILYFRFHDQAADFALKKSAMDSCGPFSRADWKAHISTSLEDANTGLLSEIGFVGLIMFSAFEKLSGLQEIQPSHAGEAYADIQRYGPWVYTILMMATCVFELIVYIRLRVAVGSFSLQLDPTDHPFRPLRLTDSFLGYLLLAFLSTVSLHILLLLAVPALQTQLPLLLGIDGAALVVMLLAEQCTLVVAGRRLHAVFPASGV